ncbi:YrhB family protein [Streptomyces sp. AS02]|nr:YrhB family protein [Streptomyces sp. AS02]
MARELKTVSNELDREYRKWSARGVDLARVAVVDVEEHEWVWIVYWQSEEFVRTRNPGAMLAGDGPYLVDRVDGRLHQIGVVPAKGGEWEADYRARIRGPAVRTAVHDLHDEIREVAAARGRLHAVRAPRQGLPAPSPAQALECVSALLNGDAPAHLVSVTVEQLVEPVNPVLAVHSIRQGNRSRPT